MDTKEFSDKYLEILTGELAGINLTRITESDEFYNKQIVDSLIPLEKSEVFQDILSKVECIVDIGFGGGFPLLPMAYKYPEKKICGLEARAKKASAVNLIAEKLDLKNVKALHQRFEDVFFDRPTIITFKAVGKCIDLLRQIKTNSNVYVFFYKGPNFYELEDLEEVEKYWKIIEEETFEIPGTLGRMFVGFKNKNVPHGTFDKKKTKDLVKVSSLFLF